MTGSISVGKKRAVQADEVFLGCVIIDINAVIENINLFRNKGKLLEITDILVFEVNMV